MTTLRDVSLSDNSTRTPPLSNLQSPSVTASVESSIKIRSIDQWDGEKDGVERKKFTCGSATECASRQSKRSGT
jgi:hypothetical protein